MSLYHAAAGIDHLERLALGRSPVHRLHPQAKLLGTFVYILVVVSFPGQSISGLLPFLLYPAVVMSLSGTPYKPLLLRFLGALPFSLMGGLANLVLLRAPAFSLGPVTVTVGGISCVSILLKTFLTVFAVLMLIATTSFIAIGATLSALGGPKILILQVILTYRYLSVLLGEAGAMYTAYMLRAPGRKGIAMKDMNSFLGQLILRSFDRSERVYRAMQCRGFKGVYYGGTTRPWAPGDYLYTLLLLAGSLGLRFFNLSWFFAGVIRWFG